MDYTICDAGPAHLPQLAALERACFSAPWTRAQLAGQLRARPRRGKARALERGELRQVRRPGVADRVVHQCASAQLVPIFASTSSGTR